MSKLNTLIDYAKRGAFDEIYTPSYAVEPLIEFLNKKNYKVVWECTDFGNSQITQYLKEQGFQVISTKIDDLDFLKDTANFDFDIIITNPPYSLKDQFLKKVYEYKKPFALLLPLTALEGQARNKLYKANGIEVLVLNKRINFTGGKGAWFNTSWFCKDLLDKDLMFAEINKEELNENK